MLEIAQIIHHLLLLRSAGGRVGADTTRITISSIVVVVVVRRRRTLMLSLLVCTLSSQEDLLLHECCCWISHACDSSSTPSSRTAKAPASQQIERGGIGCSMVGSSHSTIHKMTSSRRFLWSFVIFFRKVVVVSASAIDFIGAFTPMLGLVVG